jgi:hypothetical protein
MGERTELAYKIKRAENRRARSLRDWLKVIYRHLRALVWRR